MDNLNVAEVAFEEVRQVAISKMNLGFGEGNWEIEDWAGNSVKFIVVSGDKRAYGNAYVSIHLEGSLDVSDDDLGDLIKNYMIETKVCWQSSSDKLEHAYVDAQNNLTLSQIAIELNLMFGNKVYPVVVRTKEERAAQAHTQA